MTTERPTSGPSGPADTVAASADAAAREDLVPTQLDQAAAAPDATPTAPSWAMSVLASFWASAARQTCCRNICPASFSSWRVSDGGT